MMLFDLGYSMDALTPVEEVSSAVEHLDELFHIVLIAERLDESLIFLKELLCWEFKDIVFFTKNDRRSEFKMLLSKRIHDQLNVLNSPDTYLYNYFLEKHNSMVVKYGVEKLKEQVEILQEYRTKIFQDCDIKAVENFEENSIF